MNPTAYTVGATKSYDQSLAEEPPEKCCKLGRHLEWDRPYEGGWIFRTREEAQAFLDSGRISEVSDLTPPERFSVYGILLPNGWDTDVSPEQHPSDGVHRLLVDAPFVKLPPV
jgi:hypothetical protein